MRFEVRILLIALLQIAVLAMPLKALADMNAAAIRGTISRGEFAVSAGVKVEAVNLDNGYRKSTQTDTTGAYLITGLAPGQYAITVDDGAPIDDPITVFVGQTVVFNVQGERRTYVDGVPVGLEEEVVYVYGTQTKRVSASQAATIVTPDQIERLPKIDRNFLSDANLAPGVTIDQNPDGSIALRSGAQRANRINVFIDGVSQKDNVLKSGITGQDSSRGNPFPQSAIDQYRVITSNYKAEFEHLSGAAITAVTKSGTNELKGGAFYDVTDSAWRTETPIEIDTGEKADSRQEQYGGWLSGPIIKDSLHYFVTYERKEYDDIRETGPAPEFLNLVDNYPQFLQDAIAANTGATTARFEEDLWFVKLDWKPSDAHKFDLSVRYRDEFEITNLGGINTLQYASNKLNDDTRVRAGYNFDHEWFSNSLILTYEDSGFNPSPRIFQPGLLFRVAGEDAIIGDILNVGGGADFQFKGQEGWSIKNDLTIADFDFFGEHIVKTGFVYKEIELTAIEKNSLNPQFLFVLDSVGITGDDTSTRLEAVPYRVDFARPGDVGNPAAVSNNTQIGFYLQDDWRPIDRLQLNIGFRYDYEDYERYTNFETSPSALAALDAYDNLDNADYDINDYISSGSERNNFDGAWAARFGFSYNLTEDGNYVLFGGYGRSYDRIQFDFIQLETTKGAFPRRTIFFEGQHRLPCNDPCLEWQPEYLSDDIAGLASTAGAQELFLLNNDLRTPYSDQASLGLNVFFRDWEFEVAYKRIESRDGFHWAWGNRRGNGAFFAEGATFERPIGSPIGNGFNNLLIGRNGLESNLDTAHFKVTKPHNTESWWGASLTYTWSDGEENREFGEIFALDYPTLDGYGFNKSAGVSEHVVVGTLTLDLPWALRFSSKFNLRTAAPFYGLNCFDGNNMCFYQQGYIEERNFLGADWVYRQLDIALSRNFNIKNAGGFYARLDVLNLTNERNLSDDTGDIFRGVNNRFANPGVLNEEVGTTTGRLAGPTRTVKFSVGYNF